MRRIAIALLACFLCLTGAQIATAQADGAIALRPSAASDDSPLNDPEEDCDEFVPQSIGASGVTDSGQMVRLEVTVLLDEISMRRAEAVMTRAAQPYAPLNVDLVVVGFRKIRVVGGPPRPGGKTSTVRMEDLFARMKSEMGGTRPRGSDLVHLLTSKDVYFFDGSEPAYGLAGVADCIGGVRYPKRAFSFSEGTGEYQKGPRDISGIIAAHEIGHLMGAHHHYGNCTQGQPLMQENETPCTVMWPYLIIWNAGNFGTLEGAVVRGHAVDFASP